MTTFDHYAAAERARIAGAAAEQAARRAAGARSPAAIAAAIAEVERLAAIAEDAEAEIRADDDADPEDLHGAAEAAEQARAALDLAALVGPCPRCDWRGPMEDNGNPPFSGGFATCCPACGFQRSED